MTIMPTLINVDLFGIAERALKARRQADAQLRRIRQNRKRLVDRGLSRRKRFIPRPSGPGWSFSRPKHAVKRCARFLKNGVGTPPRHLMDLSTLLPKPSVRERLAVLMPQLG